MSVWAAGQFAFTIGKAALSRMQCMRLPPRWHYIYFLLCYLFNCEALHADGTAPELRELLQNSCALRLLPALVHWWPLQCREARWHEWVPVGWCPRGPTGLMWLFAEVLHI